MRVTAKSPIVAAAAAAILATAAWLIVPASASSTVNSPSVPVTDQSLRELGLRHGLYIGTAVDMAALNDAADPQYRALVAEQFSTVTAENVMKWESLEPTRGTYNWGPADDLVAFARANNQRVRGHVLVWHNQLPGWLTAGVADGSIGTEELRGLLQKHITDVVSHFKGKIWQWDVVNEAASDPWDLPPEIHFKGFWAEHLGSDYIADAFRWAHAADPRALLFYNDFNIAGEDGTNAKSDAVYAWAKRMLDQGVPIHGIGDQGHLDTQYGFSGTRMTADLERFASLRLKVALTEADVRTFVDNATEQVPTDPLALFAQPYEFHQMLNACLAVRNCLSFTVWGLGDAYSWVPGFFTGEGYATLYDVHLNPKEAYTTLQQDLALAARGAKDRPRT
jgi:endo-1,4-beta-xylanase